ncbi:MAG: glycosyltransferase family 2 protein [Ignavibacteria bacterium]
MHESPELSIIIVTWNSESEIIECLNSIHQNTDDLKYEIIIVDNNSSDKTCQVIENFSKQKFPEVKLISNKENTGFTRGCNTGIDSASGKNILLLNPDTKILPFALVNLLLKLNSEDNIAAVAPQLLNDNDSIQRSCRTFPRYYDMFCELSLLSLFFPYSRTFARWKMYYFSHNEEAVVDQPMAATLLIKKDKLAEIGNFDERFKMFFNDVDLCKRIYNHGYKIIFYPDAKVYHQKGISIYKDRERMIKLWNEDCLNYFKKHDDRFFLYHLLSVSLTISGYLRILIHKIKK